MCNSESEHFVPSCNIAQDSVRLTTRDRCLPISCGQGRSTFALDGFWRKCLKKFLFFKIFTQFLSNSSSLFSDQMNMFDYINHTQQNHTAGDRFLLLNRIQSDDRSNVNVFTPQYETVDFTMFFSFPQYVCRLLFCFLNKTNLTNVSKLSPCSEYFLVLGFLHGVSMRPDDVSEFLVTFIFTGHVKRIFMSLGM
jgi:hypothetical protein